MRSTPSPRHVLLAGIAIAAGSCLATAHPTHDSTDSSRSAALQPARPGQPGGDSAPRQMQAIDLPAPAVSITIEGSTRRIRANGLPAHQTGAFPNAHNPNALRPQQHDITLPLVPTIADEPTIARPEFGIALNGVIFDAGTGEFWTPDQPRAFGGGSPWNYEALGHGVDLGLDMNHAHVQPTGKYHYHGLPTGLLNALGSTEAATTMTHLGWAFDGFPIYGPLAHADAADPHSPLRPLRSSYRLKSGQRPTTPDGPGGAYDGTFGLDWEYVDGLGDLDECNGRFGVTPEFPHGTYYYVITDEFPSIPRLWRAIPDPSTQRGPGPGARPGPEGPNTDRTNRRPPPGTPGRRPGPPGSAPTPAPSPR